MNNFDQFADSCGNFKIKTCNDDMLTTLTVGAIWQLLFCCWDTCEYCAFCIVPVEKGACPVSPARSTAGSATEPMLAWPTFELWCCMIVALTSKEKVHRIITKWDKLFVHVSNSASCLISWLGRKTISIAKNVFPIQQNSSWKPTDRHLVLTLTFTAK